jgi:hypothetical protein
MSQLSLLNRRHFHAFAALSITSGSAYLIQSSAQNTTTKTEANASPPAEIKQSHVGMIETDFTDKLASKPYLNYHNPYSRHNIITSSINSTKKLWGKFARSDRNANVAAEDWADDPSGGNLSKRSERPKGVPRRMRILIFDVPEFREVFDGECRVNLSRVYPDDVAPLKYIPRKREKHDVNDDASNKIEKKELEKIEIVQKSLARSLVRCRNKQSKRIGVELLEASVYDLNPNNMRRTYQFGNYKYDPGKYGSSKHSPGGDMLQRRMSVTQGWGSRLNIRKRKVVVTKDEISSEKEDKEIEKGFADIEESVQDGGIQEEDVVSEEVTVLAEEEDEVDAPWNQYAWIEEMQIRVSDA